MAEQAFTPAASAGAYLASLRRRVERRCAVCGRRITGISLRRYCSPRCRTRAYRARRAAGERER